MDRQQILALYDDWADGICFRHPSKGEVPTVHVKTIRPMAGGIQDVRACEDCAVEMAEMQGPDDGRRSERPGEP